MARVLQILAALDFKTAGVKTYLGLLVIVAALVAGHLGHLTPDQRDVAVLFGAGLAGVGKALADKRKDPPAPAVTA